MITLLSSGVGYKNHYLSLSLVLWTFPNNELNHSHMQKRIRKSILWKSEAETGQKCTLNVKLHLAHWKGNPPDKTTGSRVQRLRTPVRGDTKDTWQPAHWASNYARSASGHNVASSPGGCAVNLCIWKTRWGEKIFHTSVQVLLSIFLLLFKSSKVQFYNYLH